MNGKKMCDLLKAEASKGNICFFVTSDNLVKANLEDFIKQPAEGILYDLNRNEVVSLHFVTQGDLNWVNNYAVALVIKKLKEIISKQDNNLLAS